MIGTDGGARRRALAALVCGLVVAACSGDLDGGAGGAGGVAGSASAPDLRSVPLPSLAASAAAEAVPDAIPPGLAGRTWAVPDPRGLVAGVTGRTGRLLVPGRERALAVAGGRLATVRSDGATSTVTVRSVPDGAILATALLPFEALSGAILGGELLVGGDQPGLLGRDPGLVAISLSTGTVRTLLPAVALDDWGGSAVRTVAVSPSGRTIVSGVCVGDRCSLDLVDPAGGARRIVESATGFPGPVTDEIAIVGDGASAWIAGIDLATGARRWTRDDGEFQHAVARADGTILQAVARAWEGTFALETLDPRTGSGRSLLVRDLADGLVLWPELSGDAVATLGFGGTFADSAASGRSIRAAAFDLVTGDLLPGAVALDLGG